MSYIAEINILCWNQLELTKNCVESIFKNTKNFKLNLWDNGSSDGTKGYLKSLKREYDNVEIYLSDKNLGFIVPNNRMAEKLSSPYVVLLNNDTIVSEGWLEKLLAPLKQYPQVAETGASGAILDENGWGTAVKPNMALDYLEGWCIALPYRIIKKFGLFDEKNLYFAYSEDSDLSLRLKEAGYKIMSVDCGVKHIGSATRSKAKNKIDFEGIQLRNHLYLLKRWHIYFKKKTFHQRVLIKRTGAFGDVLLATSVLRAVKAKYPNSTIDFHTKCGAILSGNPLINKVVQYSRKEDYDIYIDLDMAYEKNPEMHILDAYAKVSGFDLKGFNPLFYYHRTCRKFVDRKIGRGKKYVVFHTGKTWPNRSWPIERFREVAKYIQDKFGYLIVEVGDSSTDSMELEDALDLRGKTSFQELGAVLHEALFFVGIDSVVSHIAQSLYCPCILLFGAINPNYRKHPGTHTKCIWKPLEQVPCRGCHHISKEPQTFSECKRSRVVCMESISPVDVIKEVDIMNQEVYFSEVAKCRDRVLKYCQGRGLDIGCGKDKIKPDAIGIDKRNFSCVDLLCDATEIPYPDESMDYVFSSHCLEDIEDTESTLREWLRVIKDKGYLILYLPDKNLYKGVNLDHKHDFTVSDIIRILKKIGNVNILDASTYGSNNEYSFQIVAQKTI